MKISFLSLLLVPCLTFSISANAITKCPVKAGTGYSAKVEKLATNASSCNQASEIVNACAMGPSMNIVTVTAAITRCEKDVSKMSQEDAQAYSYLTKKCADKYTSSTETSDRSGYLFCHLSVTKLFVELLSKEEE